MPAPSNVVESWNVRARAYLALTRRYPLFADVAERLVGSAVEAGDRALVDIGGGAGLATEIALDAYPGLSATLAEPSEVLRDLARDELSRFGDRVVIVDADACAPPPGPFDAAISSAVMHLVDEGEALPAIAKILRPGGRFAFNIWGHSFEDTAADPDSTVVWKARLDEAIAKLGLKPRPPERPAPLPRVRTRQGIEEAAARGGLVVVSIEIDDDRPPATLHLDFAAMSPTFLPKLPPDLRTRTIELARELTTEPTWARSARVVLRKK